LQIGRLLSVRGEQGLRGELRDWWRLPLAARLRQRLLLFDERGLDLLGDAVYAAARVHDGSGLWRRQGLQGPEMLLQAVCGRGLRAAYRVYERVMRGREMPRHSGRWRHLLGRYGL